MSITVAENIVVSPEVADVLRERAAEYEFQATASLVRECFPEMLNLRVHLQEDPDEDGITRIIFDVLLPKTVTFEALSERRNAYYSGRVARLSGVKWPICSLSVDFA